MNQQLTTPQLVEAGEMPEYPIPGTERLESHFFVEWHHNRWLNSRFRLMASPDVKSAGLDLFFISQNQAPVGTLPMDDRELAPLLGLDLATWQDLKKREISPLYNWEPCLCEGEIRYHHPVILEMALKALRLKLKKLENLAKGRHRKRLKALETQIISAGGHERMAKNEAVRMRIDDWLMEHYPDDYRTSELVRAAMEAIGP